MAKQILAMLAVTTGRRVMAENQPLLDFILDPAARGIPPQYRLFLALTPGPLARTTGLVRGSNIETGKDVIVSELVFPPYAYALNFNGADGYLRGEITDWTHAAPGETDVTIELQLGFIYTPFAGDLRSRAAIDAQAAAKGT